MAIDALGEEPEIWCETDEETATRNQWERDKVAIEAVPPTDVRPVVRGHWAPRDLTYGRSYYFCSACKETVDMPTAMGIPMFRYCPNCGAGMKGGDDDG